MPAQSRWFRRALWVALALSAGSALASAAAAHFGVLPANSGQISANPGTSSAALPSFAFPDQHGEVVSKSALNGHVWIANFIFTTCTSACPLITSRLVTFQRRLPDERLRFVSFSVDPERDTEAALLSYAKRWAASESRWHLLRPDASGLGSLIANLHVELDRKQGDIIHTSRLFLVDARGNLAGSFDSADDEALERLLSRSRELLGNPAKKPPLTGTPAELFASLGCAGCHADAQLAPPLGGVFGSYVMLERGGSVLIGDDYLRQAIADPGSQLVSGYPNSMPNYGALLSADQLAGLVGYVRSLPAASSSQAASAETDPVCGMPVRVTDQTPHVDHQGKAYHFCSPACAQRFAANPAKYLAPR
jgi:protein SCO1/2